MLEAHRVSSLRSRWEVREDDAPLLVLEAKGWRSSVRYTLDGIAYEVQASWTGSQYTLTTDDGAEVARAERIGRKRWSIVTPEGTYYFRRRSIWKADQEWVADPDTEEPVGSIRRTGTWRGDAEADLPGMPTPLAVFTLAVVLLMWEQAAAAAATS
ncbi:hypothetical protein [Actinomycetospora termitidis]|uniref:Uncharacterized protein n=1 Tax=Actinomycetospora termitidis TaxID=3053470 RepID=A0ABT7M5D9_9PSEU|nr:hypothetical protein [Actinomycetospora sp. Odt1-22]MDL5154663.1 hypothetical protein [Actinomycetospora sp. Odt1-22]